MKSASKDRIKLSLIAMVLFLVLFGVWYLIWGNTKITGMYSSMTKVISVDNVESITRYEKDKTEYAYKVKEDDKLSLKYISYDENGPIVNTFILTNEQYNQLDDGEYYWFKIKFTSDDCRNGTVKQVFTDNPIRR